LMISILMLWIILNMGWVLLIQHTDMLQEYKRWWYVFMVVLNFICIGAVMSWLGED
jgi:hypothetical protein